MTDLFTTIDAIKKYSERPNIAQSQKEFLLNILHGDENRSSFHDIVSDCKKEALEALRQSIKAKLAETSFSQFSFKRLLNRALKDIEGMQKSEEDLADLAQKHPKRLAKYKKIFDTIYLKTPAEFNGTLMLPLMQGMDARLGDSLGECFGYIANWAGQLLQNKKFLGIPTDGEAPFKPVRVNSKLWEKYPDLNHLAKLTPNISLYQRSQGNLSALTAGLSKFLGEQNQMIAYDGSLNFKFYNSIEQIAAQLITLIDKAPEKIYNLNIMGYLSGHALGFCKIDEHYHFMDSNSGWFRFNNSEDFKAWLPFYFKKIGYDKIFAEYAIASYSLKEVKEEKKPSKTGGIILSCLLFPIILLGILALFFHLFVIRGFRYVVFNSKNKKEKEDEEALEQELKELEALAALEPEEPQELPKSLEPLDLPQPKAVVKEKDTSLAQVDALVDIPLKDLAKRKKQVKKDDEFDQLINSKLAFFKARNAAAQSTEAAVAETTLAQANA